MTKGYIQVYTGNGKGKTTAALGLALRAAGHGMKTFIGQFMKGQYYGELTALTSIDHIHIEQFGDEGCITKDQVTRKHREHGQAGLNRIIEVFGLNLYDLVIMDEVCVALWFGIISEKALLDTMAIKPEKTELILTGRYASEAIIEKADLVTRMEDVKHYYNSIGLPARKGIEC